MTIIMAREMDRSELIFGMEVSLESEHNNTGDMEWGFAKE